MAKLTIEYNEDVEDIKDLYKKAYQVLRTNGDDASAERLAGNFISGSYSLNLLKSFVGIRVTTKEWPKAKFKEDDIIKIGSVYHLVTDAPKYSEEDEDYETVDFKEFVQDYESSETIDKKGVKICTYRELMAWLKSKAAEASLTEKLNK